MIKGRFLKTTAGVIAVSLGLAFLSLLISGFIAPGKSKTATFNVSGQRVLFIAPHPDDETLVCGGAIIRAEQEASAVKVAWLNNGDAELRTTQLLNLTSNPTASDYLNTGIVRHLEVMSAADVLGVGARDRIFLCYPDGATNSLIKKDWVRPHLGANGYRYSPYSFAYEKNIEYTGKNLVDNLTKVISEFKPTVIIYPDTGDLHHDHWATGSFVELAIDAAGYRGRRLTYLTHFGLGWPEPVLWPGLSLSPPQGWKASGKRTDLVLNDYEMIKKFEAMSRYVSQGGPLAPNIGSFLRRNEIFYDRIGGNKNK